jgi:hypothetical protein
MRLRRLRRNPRPPAEWGLVQDAVLLYKCFGCAVMFQNPLAFTQQRRSVRDPGAMGGAHGSSRQVDKKDSLGGLDDNDGSVVARSTGMAERPQTARLRLRHLSFFGTRGGQRSQVLVQVA